MSGVFFDSNVLLYALAQGDPREPVATSLLAGGCVSVQVLNKFANVARRKIKLSWAEVIVALAAVRVLCAPPLTLALHEAALTLAERHQFSWYDALIVAAALEADCATLLSEDLLHGLIVANRLTIHNPFRNLWDHGDDLRQILIQGWLPPGVQADAEAAARMARARVAC